MKLATLFTVSVLLLTGCGASDEQEPSAVQTTSAAATTKAASAEPTEDEEPTADLPATCEAMFGDDGGIMVESGTFLAEVDEMSAENADTAQIIAIELAVYAETAADAEIQGLIEEMQVPFDEYIAAQDAGESWTFDAESFQAAANEIIEICGPHLPDEAAETEPEPQAVPTTGDYGADLEALGVVPDSVEGYREFMVERVCKSDLDDDLIGFRRDIRSIRGSTGVNDDVLRMTAMYDCPERLEPLEVLFIELDAEG